MNTVLSLINDFPIIPKLEAESFHIICLDRYNHLNYEYINYGITAYTLQFLKQMSNSRFCIIMTSYLVSDFIQTDLFSQLLYIVKIFHMNELEITLWIIYLDSIDIMCFNEDFDQPTVLLLTAFQAKV